MHAANPTVFIALSRGGELPEGNAHQRSPAMPATPLEMRPMRPEAPLKSPKLRRKLIATLSSWL